MARAVMAATAVMDGSYSDPTGSATHYYETTVPKPTA
jgi:hypothetical protein